MGEAGREVPEPVVVDVLLIDVLLVPAGADDGAGANGVLLGLVTQQQNLQVQQAGQAHRVAATIISGVLTELSTSLHFFIVTLKLTKWIIPDIQAEYPLAALPIDRTKIPPA